MGDMVKPFDHSKDSAFWTNWGLFMNLLEYPNNYYG